METTPSADTSRGLNPRRALLFISFLLLLVLGLVAGASNYVLNAEKAGLCAEIEQRLAAVAKDKSAAVTVWFGMLSDQLRDLARTDLVRLFASEVADNDLNPGTLLRMSRPGEFEPSPAGQSELVVQIGRQAPQMRRYLAEFLAKADLKEAHLLNARRVTYLSTTEPLVPSPVQDAAVHETFREGRTGTLPVREEGGRLLMDVVVPVFAPLYVDASGRRIVAVLLATADVTERVNELSSAPPAGSNREAGRVLQVVDGVMRMLPADGEPGLELPGWEADAKGELPFAVRLLPAGSGGEALEVFSLGRSVYGPAWILEQDLSVQESLSHYRTFRRNVIMAAGLVLVVAALFLVMLWWWLLGRRDRAVAAEIGRLYETVNRQKQIMDGVNTTLQEGIVLNDLNGSLLYANLSFARMAGENQRSWAGKTWNTLVSRVLGENLRGHAAEVQRVCAPVRFTETLSVLGAERVYEVNCLPFRAEAGTMTGVVSVYRDITEIMATQEKARRMVAQTIRAFMRAIEAVDPYLRGQSGRTGVLAEALAGRLGLPEHQATLRAAANLSQIGMIQLPHSLLTKTGALMHEERAELERHVEYARQALDGIDFGLPVLEAICQMYERVDGSGYPLGLAGEAIGADGRILAVANTFCALLRPRSYRLARSLDDALNILDSDQYDPHVVDALREFLETPEGKSFVAELSEYE